MSDFLLHNNPARKVMKALGLPLLVPPKLRRAQTPMVARPLEGERVVVGSAPGSTVAPTIAGMLARAGASSSVTCAALEQAFKGAGEAYGRPATRIEVSAFPHADGAHALVFDATAIASPADLRQLYDFFHPLLAHLRPSGRVLVLGRPPKTRPGPIPAAAHAALEGFVRSLAKEVGRRGATATLLVVEDGAQTRIEAVARFLLSPRSAFVSGQPLEVSARAAPQGDVAWTRPLEGKVALVTGAARGIGAATAERLAEEGAHVVCLDRPADDTLCSQVARSVGGSTLLADVGDPEAPVRIAKHLTEQHKGVDIVVHSAGVTRDKTLKRMTSEQWTDAVLINLSAVIRLDEALLGGPLRDGGRIVTLSSVAGIAGNAGQTNYAAAKAGLIGYTEQLMGPAASRGITVNAVAPGFIETRMTAAIPVMLREAARRLSNLSQGGQPRDVAEAIAFLATPGAQGLTGQVLRVCGGALAGA